MAAAAYSKGYICQSQKCGKSFDNDRDAFLCFLQCEPGALSAARDAVASPAPTSATPDAPAPGSQLKSISRTSLGRHHKFAKTPSASSAASGLSTSAHRGASQSSAQGIPASPRSPSRQRKSTSQTPPGRQRKSLSPTPQIFQRKSISTTPPSAPRNRSRSPSYKMKYLSPVLAVPMAVTRTRTRPQHSTRRRTPTPQQLAAASRSTSSPGPTARRLTPSTIHRPQHVSSSQHSSSGTHRWRFTPTASHRPQHMASLATSTRRPVARQVTRVSPSPHEARMSAGMDATMKLAKAPSVSSSVSRSPGAHRRSASHPSTEGTPASFMPYMNTTVRLARNARVPVAVSGAPGAPCASKPSVEGSSVPNENATMRFSRPIRVPSGWPPEAPCFSKPSQEGSISVSVPAVPDMRKASAPAALSRSRSARFASHPTEEAYPSVLISDMNTMVRVGRNARLAPLSRSQSTPCVSPLPVRGGISTRMSDMDTSSVLGPIPEEPRGPPSYGRSMGTVLSNASHASSGASISSMSRFDEGKSRLDEAKASPASEGANPLSSDDQNAEMVAEIVKEIGKHVEAIRPTLLNAANGSRGSNTDLVKLLVIICIHIIAKCNARNRANPANSGGGASSQAGASAGVEAAPAAPPQPKPQSRPQPHPGSVAPPTRAPPPPPPPPSDPRRPRVDIIHRRRMSSLRTSSIFKRTRSGKCLTRIREHLEEHDVAQPPRRSVRQFKQYKQDEIRADISALPVNTDLSRVCVRFTKAGHRKIKISQDSYSEKTLREEDMHLLDMPNPRTQY